MKFFRIHRLFFQQQYSHGSKVTSHVWVGTAAHLSLSSEGPNDPSFRTLSVTILPTALSLMQKTGFSRPEELCKYYTIKKQTVCLLFLNFLSFNTLRQWDHLCKLSSAVVCTCCFHVGKSKTTSGREMEGVREGCGSLSGAASLGGTCEKANRHTQTQTMQETLLICKGHCSEMHDPSSIYIISLEGWGYVSDAEPDCTLIHLTHGKDADSLCSSTEKPWRGTFDKTMEW